MLGLLQENPAHFSKEWAGFCYQRDGHLVSNSRNTAFSHFMSCLFCLKRDRLWVKERVVMNQQKTGRFLKELRKETKEFLYGKPKTLKL